MIWTKLVNDERMTPLLNYSKNRVQSGDLLFMYVNYDPDFDSVLSKGKIYYFDDDDNDINLIFTPSLSTLEFKIKWIELSLRSFLCGKIKAIDIGCDKILTKKHRQEILNRLYWQYI